VKSKTWSYSVGERRDKIGGGVRVRVYEREPGGVIYLAIFDPEMRDGRGGYRRVSLKHADRKQARAEADDAYEALRRGKPLEREPAAPTVGYVIGLYERHELPRIKDSTRRWLPRAIDVWRSFLGADTPVNELGLTEWESFIRQRSSGAIDGQGRPAAGERRKVSPGTVCLGLDAINAVFNWTESHRVDSRRRLIQENPFKGLKYPKNPNVRRAVWTHDRFERILAAAEGLQMQVEWFGKRRHVPSFLADVLVILEETGRRVGAVRQLRAGDVRLNDTTEAAPYGVILWPAGTDKAGKAWRAPISKSLRERLVKLMRDRGAMGGDAYLFPSPRSLTQPVGRDTLALYLRTAERAAGVPRLGHDTFHGLRRKWATERKHLPEKDVATAGGWRSASVMKRSYQQADDAGVLEAILGPRRLREASFQ